MLSLCICKINSCPPPHMRKWRQEILTQFALARMRSKKLFCFCKIGCAPDKRAICVCVVCNKNVIFFLWFLIYVDMCPKKVNKSSAGVIKCAFTWKTLYTRHQTNLLRLVHYSSRTRRWEVFTFFLIFFLFCCLHFWLRKTGRQWVERTETLLSFKLLGI